MLKYMKPNFFESEEEWQALTPKIRQRIIRNGTVIDQRTRSSGDKIYGAWLSRLVRRYNLSEEIYWDMHYAQDAKCAICCNYSLARLCVDHNHDCCPKNESCGKCIRGLVCRKCNILLGHADDSVRTLQSAINYLQGVV